MGIHGNATCQMVLDSATGWLVGEPNKGLPAMFVMMNGARLGVGVQGLGITEVAYQNAAAYAKDRIQGRSLSGPKAPDKPADPIIVHPDVRKMLLTARAYAEGGRAFAYWVALHGRHASCPARPTRSKAFGADMMALMTPIVKAFMTDNGFRCASECLQVFGGHGYVREWGMEQFVRDARINMIYEGTNTIQSLDLIGRKVLMDNGAKLKKFGKMVQAFAEEHGTAAEMSEFITPLADLGDKVDQADDGTRHEGLANQDEAGAAAVTYLRVVGHLVYGYFWARMAQVALAKVKADGDKVDPSTRPSWRRRASTSSACCPRPRMHIRAARSGVAEPDGIAGRPVLSRVRNATPLPRARNPDEQFHRPQGRRARRRRDGRADRRALRECQGAGRAVRPARERRAPRTASSCKAIDNLKKLSPAPLGNKDDAQYIEAANYEEHLELLKGCDLVIEAIAERLDWKHDLYKKVGPYIAPNAIFASNTSGLPIAKLAEGHRQGPARRASAACTSSIRRATCTWSS